MLIFESHLMAETPIDFGVACDMRGRLVFGYPVLTNLPHIRCKPIRNHGLTKRKVVYEILHKYLLSHSATHQRATYFMYGVKDSKLFLIPLFSFNNLIRFLKVRHGEDGEDVTYFLKWWEGGGKYIMLLPHN